METIKKKLLPFQISHVDNIVRIIKDNHSVLDASDTGTGKTYTAIASCKILGLWPIIVCPKSVITSWSKVCKYFDLQPQYIVNYETLRMGKYYDSSRNRVLCPDISVDIEKLDKNNTSNENNNNNNNKNNNNNNKISKKLFTEKITYTWSVDDKTIFIFDEAHKCSKLETNNGQILYAAKLTKKPIMILSATIADYPDKFRLFTWILNFIEPSYTDDKQLDFHKYMNLVDKWFARDPKPMIRIHNMLYPNRASRMRIDALGDLFPETQITAEAYNMGKNREQEIEYQYKIIAEELDNLKNKSGTDKSNSLVRILRAHQKIEILKVPTFVELANNFVENNYHVVLFVNFTQTLKLLATMLNTKCLIYGEQTQDERDKAIELFNNNKVKFIVCNIKAGGVGISLHDIHGGHPRASIISPTWSSIDLVQALGRIHRAGGKSKSLQRIIYAANTVEEQIADKLRNKLDNLNSLNNGDLDISAISNRVDFKKKI